MDGRNDDIREDDGRNGLCFGVMVVSFFAFGGRRLAVALVFCGVVVVVVVMVVMDGMDGFGRCWREGHVEGLIT
jgi:membrane associated rhomboid family serine protease